MNLPLLKFACTAGLLTFLVVVLVEFAVTPPESRGLQPAAAAGTPLERAENRILADHEERRIDHRTWRQSANWLLATGEPLARLQALEEALGDAPQRSIAASGYVAYYLGYTLLSQERPEEARRCWEYAVTRFEQWSGIDRPWAQGNDVLYHARSLMRLGRDEEAYEVLRTLPGVEGGSPNSQQNALALFRTLAEIDRPEQAQQLIVDLISRQGTSDRTATCDVLLRSSRQWRLSSEPDAADVALRTAAVLLIGILSEEETVSTRILDKVRSGGLELRRTGLDSEAMSLWEAGENAVQARADDYSTAEPEMLTGSLLWVARFRALRGNTAGCAEAIAQIPAGAISPDELVRDPDLHPVMYLPYVRAAVRKHGEPADWLSGSARTQGSRN